MSRTATLEVSSGSQTMTQPWDPAVETIERRTFPSFPGSGRVLDTHANPHQSARGNERIEEEAAQTVDEVTVSGNAESASSNLGETNEDDDQIRQETARYLSQVPPILRIRPGTTVQTLQQLYESEADVRQPKANAGPSGTSVSRSETDEVVDILALDLATGSVTHIGSVRDLRQHFRRGHHNHTSHVYIIAEQFLPAQAVGLLGSELELSADFWALQKYDQEDEPERSRPSNVLRRRSVRVRLPEGRLASVALRAGPLGDSTVFLLPRYRLLDDVVRDLVYSGFSVGDAEGLSTATTTVLGQRSLNSLDVLLSEVSSVRASGGPTDPLALCRILFRLAIAEWAAKLKDDDHGNSASSDHHGGAGEAEALLASIETLRQALGHACLITRSTKDPNQDILMWDLKYLGQWARRLLERRRNPTHPDPAQRWPAGAPPPPPTGTEGQKPGSYYGGGATAADGSEGGPPSGGGGGGSGHDTYQHHMKRKVDQVAYATVILLSMSFVTSVYGMNLDIFTGPNGGLVSVNKFLATALPFTAGLFVVTFFPDFFDHRLTRNLRVEPV